MPHLLYVLRIEGDSMSPTLQAGQVVLALSSRWVRVRPGRIVAFERGRTLFIKRALTQESDGWFVVGDQPARSTDSRRFGPVPVSAIRAVAVIRLRPLAWLLEGAPRGGWAGL